MATCIRCGYRLRHAKDAAAKCPECGTPCKYSIGRPLLRYADPEVVLRIEFGVWLLASIPLISLFVAAAIAMMEYAAIQQAATIGAATRVIYVILLITSAWLVTTPLQSIDGVYNMIRIIARFAPIANVLALILSILESGNTAGSILLAVNSIVMSIFDLSIRTIDIIGVGGIILYLSFIANMLNTPPLSARVKWVGLTYVSIMAASMIFNFASMHYWRGPLQGRIDALMVLMNAAIAFGTLFAAIWLTIILVRYGIVLRAERLSHPND